MEVLHISQLVKTAKDRFINNVSGNCHIGPRSPVHDYITKLKLIDNPTKEEFESIVGNKSWTTINCECCRKDVEIAVFMNTSHTNEYGESLICQECLEYAVKTIKEYRNEE